MVWSVSATLVAIWIIRLNRKRTTYFMQILWACDWNYTIFRTPLAICAPDLPCCRILGVNTLQEHQKFRTNATISLISDLLKSMGGIFPLKNLWISQRSQHIFKKLVDLYSLTMLCVVICYQFIFKCNWAGNQRKLQFCLTTPIFINQNFWHVWKIWFQPVRIGFLNH